MTREIEYRAYCKSKGEIRDVVDIYFGKKQEVQSVRVLCEHDGMSYPSDDIYVDDFILMQYTGIKDKQGVGIYEGDILLASAFEAFEGAVVYEKGAFRIYPNNMPLGGFYDTELEVIGNIYEEKE